MLARMVSLVNNSRYMTFEPESAVGNPPRISLEEFLPLRNADIALYWVKRDVPITEHRVEDLLKTAEVLDFPEESERNSKHREVIHSYLHTLVEIIPPTVGESQAAYSERAKADMAGVTNALRRLAAGEQIDSDTLDITAYVVDVAQKLSKSGCFFKSEPDEMIH